MARDPSTLEQSALGPGGAQRALEPGLAVLFSGGSPLLRVLQLPERAGGELELGRGDEHGVPLDPRISRRHVRLRMQSGRWLAQDLGSQNGTYIDGRHAPSGGQLPVERMLRMGDTLILVCKDVRPLLDLGVKFVGSRVLGPATQMVQSDVLRAARLGTTLHIHGESGAGKESLAQAFHDAKPGGRLVAVNCAAIPQGVAERLFFGARRGAYSGADSDAEGYIQAADGGTLFLDEVGDLDMQVQPKLLRVLESGEFWQLGAPRPRHVSLRVVSATHRDLRAQVAAGRFREDLFFRLGRPAVEVLPLRKRPEEIPWLVATQVQHLAPELQLHVSFVEACLLRPWPGNVRELLVEVRAAVHAALARESPRIEACHLEASAGTAFTSAAVIHSAPTSATESEPGTRTLDPAERLRLETALREQQGNVSAAARALGMHRTQFRRLLLRHGIDSHSGPGEGEKEDSREK